MNAFPLSFSDYVFTMENNLKRDITMGFGRKSQAVKMLQRKGQAKKKAKIKEKIAVAKAAKKK